MSTSRALLATVVTVALTVPAGLASAAPRGGERLDSELVTTLEDGRTVDAVLVSGGTAYAGGIDGMGIYDVSDPAHAERVAGTNGWIRGLASDGTTLFVQEGSGADGTVVVLDVADPASPAVRAWIEPPLVPGKPPSDFPPQLSFEGPLAVRDGLLYVVSRDFYNPDLIYRALSVYDVSEPADPVLLGQVPLHLTADAQQVVLAGHYAYVSSSAYLETIDVADPAQPVASPAIRTPSAGVVVDGPLLYSCTGILGGRVEVYGLEDPAHPTDLGAVVAPSELMTCAAVALRTSGTGRSLLLVGWEADEMPWLSVYDVTPPIRVGDASMLMNVGTITGPANESITSIEVDGSYVYTAQWYAGVQVSYVDWASAVAQQEQQISKVPSRDRYVLTRKGGVATWKFGALLQTPAGEPITGKAVRLQHRLPSGRWSTDATLTTSAAGGVLRKLVFHRAGTTWWRWLSPADSAWLSATTPATQVVVR